MRKSKNSLASDFMKLSAVGFVLVFGVTLLGLNQERLDFRSKASSENWVSFKTSKFEGDLSKEWDQISAASGTFSVVAEGSETPPTPNGSNNKIAKLYQDGTNSPDGSFSRSIWQLPDWGEGRIARSSAWYYLPSGFFSKMQGAVQLMGYDTYPALGNQYRLAIYNNDKQTYIFVMEDHKARNILKAQQLPEGEWFKLTIENKLSNTNGWSRLYLNDQLIAQTDAQNCPTGLDRCGDTMPNAPITRSRYGLVAIANGVQTNPLTIYMDDVEISIGTEVAHSPVPTASPTSSPVPSPSPVNQPSPVPSPTSSPEENNPPMFHDMADRAQRNHPFEHTLVVTDKDTKDAVTVTAVSLPSGISLENCSTTVGDDVRVECRVKGSFSSKGNQQLQFQATDSSGNTTFKTYRVKVN